MTEDGASGNTADNPNEISSVILWSDNPERDYFQAVMQEQFAERMDQGRGEASLIGDSTMASILEDHQTLGTTTDDQPSLLLRPLHDYPDEGDTVENIQQEAGSIVAWFSKRKRDRTSFHMDSDVDGSTLESSPDVNGSGMDPPTGRGRQPRQNQQQQPPKRSSKNDDWANVTSPVKAAPSALASPPPTRCPSGLLQQQQRPPKNNNIIVDHEIEAAARGGMGLSREVPGFIFVTSGHSSAVQTRGSVGESGLFSAASPDAGTPRRKTLSLSGEEAPRKKCLWARIVVICLLLAVIVSSVMMAVVVTQRKKTGGNQSNSGTTDGSSQAAGAFPTPAPFASPTAAPPTAVTVNVSPVPSATLTTLSPTETPSASVLTTPSPTFRADTSQPTVAPTTSPTTMATTDVVLRLAPLSPGSLTAWSDPTTPQSRALAWLRGDQTADSYSNRQLVQRYSLATLYYSTDGPGWNTGSSGSTWLVPSVNECSWPGVECMTSVDDIRVLRLTGAGLSGTLPPEFNLLSDTLEELYLNSNEINGTLPTTFGSLSNLRRLQLTGNKLVGNIPSQLESLHFLRLLSLKNNQFTGTLPPALGRLSSLVSMDLGKNDLVGTIPSEFGDLPAIESIYLTDNSLSGDVPVELENLTSLKTLVVKGNDLVGIMPTGLCDLNELVSDCLDAISCDCCTECCADGGSCSANTIAPTSSPTSLAIPTSNAPTTSSAQSGSTSAPTFAPSLERTATEAPTGAPTAAPISPTSSVAAPVSAPFGSPADCVSSIATERTCYENGDDIVVNFVNCEEASPFDWIGVWPSDADPESLVTDPLAWVWACGDQFCSEAAQSGEAIFFNARGGGSFRIVLLRSGDSNQGPFLAHASSEPFRMAQSCF